VYLDSSALVKLVIHEAESPALHRYLRGEPDRASCALARVEVLRAVRGHGSPALTRARRLLQRLHLVQIDEELLDAAAALDAASCGAWMPSTWLLRSYSAMSRARWWPATAGWRPRRH
jgi:uncharacterized protein with PIN domain